MNIKNLQIWTCLLTLSLCGVATAQSSSNADNYHPFLSDTFNLGIGAFGPQKNFKLQVDGTTPGDNIDFEDALNLEDSETTLAINFRWRYSRNWSLFGQYWAVDSEGGAILTQDIEFEGETYQAGTFARSGVKNTVARMFFGRSFLNNTPGHELGLGLGLHLMEIDAFIEGQVISGATTVFRRESVSAPIPLPNLGAWYMYSWSPKWVFQARVDWLSVDLGDYSGGLLGGMVGVNYQISDTFGVGLSYNTFGIDVDADGSDIRGRIETSQTGPRLALTASW